jgi:hypothetical protein
MEPGMSFLLIVAVGVVRANFQLLEITDRVMRGLVPRTMSGKRPGWPGQAGQARP